MIKRTLFCYFILICFAVGIVACGDSVSQEDSLDAKMTPPPFESSQPGGSEEDSIQMAEVNFAAEEAAIRKLFVTHDEAISQHSLHGVMAFWLKTRDVFMLPPFGGTVQIIETWQRISDSWEATWVFFGKRPMRTRIERIGIDARGQNATAVGTWRYIGPHAWDLIAVLKKDEQGNWKFRAIDYAEINQGLIKEIKMPEQ